MKPYALMASILIWNMRIADRAHQPVAADLRRTMYAVRFCKEVDTMHCPNNRVETARRRHIMAYVTG